MTSIETTLTDTEAVLHEALAGLARLLGREAARSWVLGPDDEQDPDGGPLRD